MGFVRGTLASWRYASSVGGEGKVGLLLRHDTGGVLMVTRGAADGAQSPEAGSALKMHEGLSGDRSDLREHASPENF